MRRLPIFLVIDVSESMAGDNHRNMQEGMSRLITSLRSDPHALESVYVSVIAFAGVARTIAPLVELYAFYPPRLPLGSGTSIGAALDHLMDEMEKNIIRKSDKVKGDFKPIVFFMSDGSATDDPSQAIARWQRDFATRATLVAIGIGPFADLSRLATISTETLRLEQSNEDTFKQFIRWLSDTVTRQSRSLGMDTPITLDKKGTPALSLIKDAMAASAVDENYVIINGLCAKRRLPYLMKYERLPEIPHIPTPNGVIYGYTGVYPAEKDFADWSDQRANANTISTSSLIGGGGCPHCGAASAFAACSCGQIFCVSGETEVTCPGCNRHLQLVPSTGDFDVGRARG